MGRKSHINYPVIGREQFRAFGVFIFPIYSPFNEEPRSYLEFPNYLIVDLGKL